MAGGFSQAEQVAILDNRFPTSGASDYVMYSENGTTESTKVGRHAIGATGWAGATNATPSVKANNAALSSPAATGSGSITHYAIVSASSGGNQRIDWTTLQTAIPIIPGTVITWAIGTLQVTQD